MTSLFGRMLPLFVGVRRVEDLFTEAVARLFERRNDLCIAWLEEIGAISPSGDDYRSVRVTTQKSFVAMEDHGSGSRPDLIVEISRIPDDEETEPHVEVVMVESKISSGEGSEQLRRYAGHLGKMSANRKTLIYITRAYDPKKKDEILAGTEGVEFSQLRWHDFYKHLQTTEKDALVEEVMLFMEEQGMSRSHRLSATDLMALSGVPRAFEIFDETLGDEVRVELEAFTGNKVKRESADRGNITRLGRYFRNAPLQGTDLFCLIGFNLWTDDEYPEAIFQLEMRPHALKRKISTSAMRSMQVLDGWGSYNLEDPTAWSGVYRSRSFADFLHEEDHIAAIKHFFIESIHQLRDEFTKFKRENPELPWNGGS